MTTKRVNKTKPEIADEMIKNAKVLKEKELGKKIFACITNQKTIYDAQTVVQAVAGYISLDLMRKEKVLKVSDIVIDISKEKDETIVVAFNAILEAVKDESAKDISLFLEKFGGALSQYSSVEYMKRPMSDITIEQFIA
jgi:hypothetical protein